MTTLTLHNPWPGRDLLVSGIQFSFSFNATDAPPELGSALSGISGPTNSHAHFSGFQAFSRPPVTGRPCRLNSISMTFHLPTCFSLSIGVYLRSRIFTLGKLIRFSSALRDCANFLGLGFFTRNPSSALVEFISSMEGSGMRRPVSCVTRFMI